MRSLTFIEIDVPSFVETSPASVETFRFTYPCDYTPADIEAIPSLLSMDHSPATISLGKDLGGRASLNASFTDHQHIFDGEPFDQGSFFGKWRARYGQKLQGRPLRWIQGLEGQTLDQMETRHFVIEASTGPGLNGVYTLQAKDMLKFADGDRAQAPRPNNGFMVGGIDDNDMAFILSPAGIGNAEYATSGFVALGGEEIVSFTRSGDNMTIVARAQMGTTAQAHDAGSRAQTVLQYIGEDPADIIYDLLTEYTNLDPSYLPLASWQIETANYLQQNYSANIAEPTDVNRLVSELIEQAALVMWWEPLTQLVRLQVLRAIPTTAAPFDAENVMEGSLQVVEQPAQRVSQVFTYFGQRNPLAPIDEERNYRSQVLTIDSDAEVAYGTPMIRKIFSRWIPFGARSVALRLNDLLLGRFRDPPRQFAFEVFRYSEGGVQPSLGAGYQLGGWPIQNVDGTPAMAPIQVTRLDPRADRFRIVAEELLFESLDPADLVNRVIIIDAAINDINLRTIHDSIYPDPDVGASPAENVRFIIEANVIVGSTLAGAPAVTVGDWPVGYPVSVEIYGRIQGKGGNGGRGSTSTPQAGQAGGTAIYTRFPIDLTLFPGGQLWGGGGGGGADYNGDEGPGAGGGGGAGTLAGNGGAGTEEDFQGEAGTSEQGGQGGGNVFKSAGDGGDPGQAGETTGAAGGAAGRAVDGISFVTLDDQTSGAGILGPQVN